MVRYDLISVVVPVLNEAASLAELYERTRRVLEGVQPFEFIIVDDGSRDDTLARVRALRAVYANISIISHYANHGKSLALMQAFAIARGEVAVVMDGDLQDRPEMIPRFLAQIENGYDLVNGWRQERRDRWGRRLVSALFNRLTARLLRCPLHDINCGFKALRRQVYRRLELRGDLHRLIPAIAAGQGFRVGEVPVEHCGRRFGRSRYRLLRHRGLLDIVAVLASNATQLRPFHVFSELALACWLVAVVALVGWLTLTVGVDPGALAARVCTPLVGMVGVGAALLGLLLPLFGFLLEMTACRVQDPHWREQLVKERVEADVSIYERGALPEGVSLRCRRQTVSEPDAEPVLVGEGAPDRWLDCPGHAAGSSEALGSRLR
ncbi:MAG TPA: glycosyltransferase family 2 protein [Phycisphaerae bacterium]|nr:glycosyltransferase family 2 protein [Phycisphaerae bacterium]HNU44487.1 glycosyltransferase family 2 protein [Phycisphaerae bacterium]